MQSTEIIYRYFPDLTTLRKDVENLYIHHVLHSLSIARVVSFQPGASVLDAGTGGGFPGIPLAILFPRTHFHLVDSIGKKITVVKNIADALKLENVKAEKIRVEELTERYDFIVSRAVTRMAEFYGWTRNLAKDSSRHALDNGILYLKGGDVDQELAELGKPYALYALTDFFSEDFFETKKLIFIPL